AVAAGGVAVQRRRAAVDAEGDVRAVGRVDPAGTVVHLDVAGQRVLLADAVHAVRRDEDPRVDDVQRLTGSVGRGVGRVRRIAEVVAPERTEAGAVRGERERGRVEARVRRRTDRREGTEGAGIRLRGSGAVAVQEPVDAHGAGGGR